MEFARHLATMRFLFFWVRLVLDSGLRLQNLSKSSWRCRTDRQMGGSTSCSDDEEALGVPFSSFNVYLVGNSPRSALC